VYHYKTGKPLASIPHQSMMSLNAAAGMMKNSASMNALADYADMSVRSGASFLKSGGGGDLSVRSGTAGLVSVAGLCRLNQVDT
jgi:hypothetical protein